MYTTSELNEVPDSALLVVINGDGTVTVYEAGDDLPEVGGDG